LIYLPTYKIQEIVHKKKSRFLASLRIFEDLAIPHPHSLGEQSAKAKRWLPPLGYSM
jgi:hypothetical protein